MNLQFGTGKKIKVITGHLSPKIALCAKKGLKMPQNGLKTGCWARPIQLTQAIVEASYDARYTRSFLAYSSNVGGLKGSNKAQK